MTFRCNQKHHVDLKDHIWVKLYLNAHLFLISIYHCIVPHMPHAVFQKQPLYDQVFVCFLLAGFYFPRHQNKCIYIIYLDRSTLPSQLCRPTMTWLGWAVATKAAGQNVGRRWHCGRGSRGKLRARTNTCRKYKWAQMIIPAQILFAIVPMTVHLENLASYLKKASGSVFWFR